MQMLKITFLLWSSFRNQWIEEVKYLPLEQKDQAQIMKNYYASKLVSGHVLVHEEVIEFSVLSNHNEN